MKSVEGVITIVQEGRFQMTDRQGVSRLFVLSPNAAMETGQLVPLGHSQTPVRVTYRDGDNGLAHVATRIDTLRTDAARTDAARTDAARTDTVRTDAVRTDATGGAR